MLRYIKKHAVLAFLSVLVSIIAQITMPISAVLEQKMIDFIVQRNMDGFAKMLWYAAMVVLATGIAYFLEALTANKFRASMTEELRNDLYDSVMGKSPTSFNERDTAEYISIINNDVNTVSNNFSTPLFKLAGVGFSTGVSLAVMACYSLPLAVLAVLFSLLSFYIPAVLTKHLQKKFVEQTMAQSALSVQLKETLNGHEVISGFGVFEKIRERFSNANRVLTKTLYKIELLVSGLQNSTLVIGRCIKFITFLIAGHMAFRGKITIGTVLLFVSLYEYFSSGIMMFSQVVPLLKGCKPIMDKLTGIVDGKDSTFTGTLSPSFKTQIRIEDLHYAYREDIPVLTGVNLLVRKKKNLFWLGPAAVASLHSSRY